MKSYSDYFKDYIGVILQLYEMVNDKEVTAKLDELAMAVDGMYDIFSSIVDIEFD